MDRSNSSTSEKKVRVKYCNERDNPVINLRIKLNTGLVTLKKMVCEKINKITHDGTSVKANDLILSYEDEYKELEIENVSIIFNDTISIINAKIKKTENYFANYKDIDYLMEILYNYSPQDDKSDLIKWCNSAKNMIDEHLYKCVFESSESNKNAKYIISLFYILYEHFKSERLYSLVLKTVSKIDISRIIFSKYIEKQCDEYRRRMYESYSFREETREDFLLYQSLCFLSLYEREMNEKWEVTTIKSIIEKLKPVEMLLSDRIKEYYGIIDRYLSLYDEDSLLVERLPIIPTSEEIHSDENAILLVLRDNKLTGYKSIRDYLATHYLLFRADVILPLQQTITVYFILFHFIVC